MFTTEDFNITEIIEERLSSLESKDKEYVEKEVESFKSKMKVLSLDFTKKIKKDKESQLSILADTLQGHIEHKKLIQEDIENERYAELVKPNEKRLEENEERIKKMELQGLRTHAEINMLKELIKRKSLQVNNHTKLLEWYLDVDALYGDLKVEGFKGKKEDFVECLLYALDATDVYTNTELLTEEEYFKTLVHQMNFVI